MGSIVICSVVIGCCFVCDGSKVTASFTVASFAVELSVFASFSVVDFVSFVVASSSVKERQIMLMQGLVSSCCPYCWN